MKYLPLLLILLIGCGTTASVGKTRTLNVSNLKKESPGFYKMIPQAKKESNKAPTIKASGKPIKINWFSLFSFYFSVLWSGIMAWMVWKIIKEYKKKKTNPFEPDSNNPSLDLKSQVDENPKN